MSICCVEGCDVQDSDDITYFTFPIKPVLRKKWRAAIKSTEKLHDDSKVCERHFKETDYELIRGKLRLKAGVVPCIFTNDKSTNESQSPVNKSEEAPENNSEKSALEASAGQEPTSEAGQQPSADAGQVPSAGGHQEELLTTPDFMTLADLCGEQANDSAENCTIECVPEAILNHDSDTHSETDLHKEDIENIIANYHIKQNKELAERLKASEELDRQKQLEYKQNGEKNAECVQNGDDRSENGKKAGSDEKSAKIVTNSDKSVANSDKSVSNSDKSVASSGQSVSRSVGRKRRGKKAARIGSESRSVRSSQDSDCILTEEPKPQFVEISVDKGDKVDNGDCMMLLESVQVDVDPSALLDGYHTFIADEPPKEEAISLLTSSDSDDVILQEPHIDTVEVSSSDSDSKPLVCLATEKMRRLYQCFECKFTTYSMGQYRKHRRTHTRPNQLVCSCGAEVDSKMELRRHERSHRKLQCTLCDYNARHNAALVCHMQTHGVTVQTVHMSDGSLLIKEDGKKTKTRKKLKRKRYKCDECSYVGLHRRDLDAHVEELH